MKIEGLEAGVISVIMLPSIAVAVCIRGQQAVPHFVPARGIAPEKADMRIAVRGLSRCPAALRSCHPLQACRPRVISSLVL